MVMVKWQKEVLCAAKKKKPVIDEGSIKTRRRERGGKIINNGRRSE
jgi:hypothetical protein